MPCLFSFTLMDETNGWDLTPEKENSSTPLCLTTGAEMDFLRHISEEIKKLNVKWTPKTTPLFRTTPSPGVATLLPQSDSGLDFCNPSRSKRSRSRKHPFLIPIFSLFDYICHFFCTFWLIVLVLGAVRFTALAEAHRPGSSDEALRVCSQNAGIHLVHLHPKGVFRLGVLLTPRPTN